MMRSIVAILAFLVVAAGAVYYFKLPGSSPNQISARHKGAMDAVIHVYGDTFALQVAKELAASLRSADPATNAKLDLAIDRTYNAVSFHRAAESEIPQLISINEIEGVLSPQARPVDELKSDAELREEIISKTVAHYRRYYALEANLKAIIEPELRKAFPNLGAPKIPPLDTEAEIKRLTAILSGRVQKYSRAQLNSGVRSLRIMPPELLPRIDTLYERCAAELAKTLH